MHRSGELVAVAIPDPRDEAVRDLIRAREDAVIARLCARQQLMALLLRLGQPYRGGKGWTQKHLQFLAEREFESPQHRIVYTEYRIAVESASDCVTRLDAAFQDAFETWRFRPVVESIDELAHHRFSVCDEHCRGSW